MVNQQELGTGNDQDIASDSTEKVQEGNTDHLQPDQNILNDLSFVASVAQLFLLTLTVVYSNEQYDLWDLLIAGFIIYLWKKNKLHIKPDSVSSQLAKVGVSIAMMIIVMFILVYLVPLLLPGFGPYLQKLDRSDYKELILSAIEIGMSLLIYGTYFWVPSRIKGTKTE